MKMCPVEKMQQFAIRHEVKNSEALPVVLNHMANTQGYSLDQYLSILDRRPNLSLFVAQIAEAYKE